jgi:hypothetical protein
MKAFFSAFLKTAFSSKKPKYARGFGKAIDLQNILQPKCSATPKSTITSRPALSSFSHDIDALVLN